MNRVVLCVGLLLAVLLSVQVYAYTPYQPKHYTQYDGGTSEHCYVLVQRTGLDVRCVVVAKTEDAKPQLETIQRNNVEYAKANKALKAEITKLNSELSSKKNDLAKAKDDSAKADAQKAVDDVKAQIKDKQSQFKPLTTWDLPMAQFNKRADADKFIEQVSKAAEAAKARAAEKEAKDKEKDKDKSK